MTSGFSLKCVGEQHPILQPGCADISANKSTAQRLISWLLGIQTARRVPKHPDRESPGGMGLMQEERR